MIVTAACLCGCEDSSISVQLSVPDGYSGYFWVVVDKKDGQVVKTDNGVVRLRIPENGILRVRDDDFLAKWHKLYATSHSGKALKTSTDDDVGPNDVAIRALTTTSIGVSVFLVGTAADEKRYREKAQTLGALKDLERRDAAASTRPSRLP